MNVAIINCFDTYEHRVDLLYDFFVKQGDNVRVYTSDFKHIEKVKRTACKKDFIYLHAMAYHKNLSANRILSHARFAADVFARVAYQKIDLLWILVPPNSLVKQAAAYKKKHSNVKVIFDIIDVWPETMPVEKIKKLPPVEMWRKLRDNYISCADHIVTECDLFQEKLEKVVPAEKMTTIYLAREIKPFHAEVQLQADEFSLCYLGSINNIIDIPTIAEIIREIRVQKPVTLHIIGDGEKRQELITTAEQAGATVHFHGKIYDAEEKQRIFDTCHYGLNVMKCSVCVGLTMKSMDYFESGLPIINSIHGDTWNLVAHHGLGVNYTSGAENAFDYQAEMRTHVRSFFEENLSVAVFEEKLKSVLS